jgi:hypothetical protein
LDFSHVAIHLKFWMKVEEKPDSSAAKDTASGLRRDHGRVQRDSVVGRKLDFILVDEVEESRRLSTNGGTSGGECMVKRFNDVHGQSKTSLGCTTSNDVRLATFTLVGDETFCDEGDMITISLVGHCLCIYRC